MTATEPVIEVLPADGTAPAGAYLADVLIVTARDRAVRDTCADLFRTFPGLTLVTLPRPDGQILIGVRDGTLLTFRPRRAYRRPRGGDTSALRTSMAAARLAYTWWAAGRTG